MQAKKRADSGATAQKTALFNQYFPYFTDSIIILPMQKHARSPGFPSFFTYFTNSTNKSPYIE